METVCGTPWPHWLFLLPCPDRMLDMPENCPVNGRFLSFISIWGLCWISFQTGRGKINSRISSIYRPLSFYTDPFNVSTQTVGPVCLQQGTRGQKHWFESWVGHLLAMKFKEIKLSSLKYLNPYNIRQQSQHLWPNLN